MHSALSHPAHAPGRPVSTAGSEGVTVCKSEEQVRTTFSALQGTVNVLGRTNREVRRDRALKPRLWPLNLAPALPSDLGLDPAVTQTNPATPSPCPHPLASPPVRQVLLMEFLAGDEYVVDTVSRDGVHKCVCIWKYIKFPLNGADNVFYGQRLMCIDSEPHLAQMVKVRRGASDPRTATRDPSRYLPPSARAAHCHPADWWLSRRAPRLTATPLLPTHEHTRRPHSRHKTAGIHRPPPVHTPRLSRAVRLRRDHRARYRQRRRAQRG